MRDRLGGSTGARRIGLVAMLALAVVGVGVRVVGAAGAQQGDPTTFGSNVRSGGDISTPDFRVTRYKGVSATQDRDRSAALRRPRHPPRARAVDLRPVAGRAVWSVGPNQDPVLVPDMQGIGSGPDVMSHPPRPAPPPARDIRHPLADTAGARHG